MQVQVSHRDFNSFELCPLRPAGCGSLFIAERPVAAHFSSFGPPAGARIFHGGPRAPDLAHLGLTSEDLYHDRKEFASEKVFFCLTLLFM